MSESLLHSHDAVAALLPGSILRDASGNAWKRGEGSWVGTADGPAYWPEVGDVEALRLPAQLLWSPGATA